MIPKTAVIVAAGNGTRLRQGRKKAAPKPLFRLGGLRLIERVILTLRSGGIEKFRIVVGYRGEEVREALEKSRVLKKHGVKPQIIACPDYRKGNGHSLASAMGGLAEPFLLAMSDHVYDPAQVEALLEQAKKRGDRVLLATDPEPGRTFDLEDATKVNVDAGGAIVDIGKTIASYSQVDTGLFYFPAGASLHIVGAVRRGCHSISDVVRGTIRQGLFESVPVKGASWQDVDNEAMAHRAEKMLLRNLAKPTDGFVSRHLNRKLSVPASRLLVKLGVTPNMVTTGVLLMGLLATALVFFPEHLWIAAILFQLGSVFDGSDGEVARLTFGGTRSGAWYDSIADSVRYVSFYAALDISLALAGGSPVYVVGAITFIVLSVVSVVLMILHLKMNSDRAVFFAVSQEIEDIPDDKKTWWHRLSILLSPLFKLDFLALLTMVLILLGLAPVVFGITIFCSVLMAVNVFYLLKRAKKSGSKRAFPLHKLPDWGRTIFSIVGLSAFAAALYFVPWDGVQASIMKAGWWVLPVFMVPLGWFLMNTAGLHVLLRGRVPFGVLLYNRLVGEALNATIPMANLGGELFKVYHLSRHVKVEEALPAIVSDKIVNISAGLLFSGACLIAGFFLPHGLPPSLALAMVPAGALSLAAGILLSLALISPLVKSLLGRLMKLVRRDPEEIPRPGKGPLAGAMACHLAGRVLLTAELAGFLLLLTQEAPQLSTLIILAGFTGLLGQVFFMIPQGLGVNEMGITGIMMLMGTGETVGMALAILRRGRMVFWAVAGLGIFAAAQGAAMLRKLNAALLPSPKPY
ncbi:MAG: lysylphosphatidylglycerol synthase domain-containing protein [Pseudomonadota bacterium]